MHVFVQRLGLSAFVLSLVVSAAPPEAPARARAGAKCRHNNQCSSGLCDLRHFRCVPKHRSARVGEWCGHNNNCRSGMCDVRRGRYKCAPVNGRGRTNQYCINDLSCGRGLQCERARCVKLVVARAGGRCTQHRGCRTGKCDMRYKRCVPSHRSAKLGAWCGHPNNCRSGMCDLRRGQNRCVPANGTGRQSQPCINDLTCQRGLACSRSRCVKPTRAVAGGRCTSHTACASGKCDFAYKKCVPKHRSAKLGEWCGHNNNCQSGTCDVRRRRMVCVAANGTGRLNQPCINDLSCTTLLRCSRKNVCVPRPNEAMLARIKPPKSRLGLAWRGKLLEKLEVEKRNFRNEDYFILKKHALEGNPRAFHAHVKKAYGQGFLCQEHKQREHCSEHCNKKHVGMESGLRAGCKAGCHVSSYWIGPALKRIGKWFDDAGKSIKGWIDKAGKWLAENWMMLVPPPLQPIAFAIKQLFSIIDHMVRARDFVKGLKNWWNALIGGFQKAATFANKTIKEIFGAFAKVTQMERFDFNRITRFADSAANGTDAIIKHFVKAVQLPPIMGDLIGAVLGHAVTRGMAIAVGTPIALISLGVRKLMEFLIPKIIQGIGELSKPRRLAKKILDKVFPGSQNAIKGVFLDVFSTGLTAMKEILKNFGLVGSLVQMLIKSKRDKERLKQAFLAAADIAGRIRGGIEQAMKLAAKARTGKFSEVDKAFSSLSSAASGKLRTEDVIPMAGALLDLLGDFAKTKLSDILGKLLHKAVGMGLKLLDIPRNAVVGAVGSIPFVGGLLSSALNFGIGFVFDLIRENIVGSVLGAGEKIFGRIFGKVKGTVLGALKSKRTQRDYRDLLQVVREASGHVERQMKLAAQGVQGAVASVAQTALDRFILRGVADPKLRSILSQGIAFVLGKVAGYVSGKGRSKGTRTFGRTFSLSHVVVEVLQHVKKPLVNFVAAQIPDRNLRGFVSRGLTRIVDRVANPRGVQGLMKNPVGFLADLGTRLLKDNKPGLIELITKGNAALRKPVEQAILALEKLIRSRGASGLLAAGQALSQLLGIVALDKAVLQGIRDPKLREILATGIGWLLSKVSDVAAGNSRGGSLGSLDLAGAVARVLQRVKAPLAKFFAAQVTAARSAVVDQVKNTQLRGLIENALTLLIDEMANPAGVKRLLKDPARFFGELGERLLAQNRSRLVALITGGNALLGTAVGKALDTLRRLVKKGGVRGLIRANRVVAQLLATTALDRLVLQRVRDPKLRRIIADGIGWAVGEITKLASGKGAFAKGAVGFDLQAAAIQLLQRLEKPIAKFVGSRVDLGRLRGAAARAVKKLRALVERGAASAIGRLATRSGIKKVLGRAGDFLRELALRLLQENKRQLVGLLTQGQAMLGAPVTAAIDGLVEVVKQRGFGGLTTAGDLIARLASVLQGLALSRIPEPIRGLVGRAFKAIAPTLRSATGRDRLIAKGPSALWAGLVSYLRKLYKRISSLVRRKAGEAQRQVLDAILAIESMQVNPAQVVAALTALAGTLERVKLPDLGFSL